MTPAEYEILKAGGSTPAGRASRGRGLSRHFVSARGTARGGRGAGRGVGKNSAESFKNQLKKLVSKF